MYFRRIAQQTEISAAGRALPSALDALREAAIPWLVTRSAVFVTATALQPLTATAPGVRLPGTGSAPLAALGSSWDSVEYASVALNGYSPVLFEWGHNYYNFPLYPAAIKTAATLFGFPPTTSWYGLAGVLLNHVLLLAALALLYTLTLRLTADQGLARRTVWVLAVLPWSFIFSMAYTEPLFLTLATAAILAALPGTIQGTLTGGLLAALCALTRPQGLAVALAIMCLAALAPTGVTRMQRVVRGAMGVMPGAIALLGYAAFVADFSGTGDMLAIPHDRAPRGIGWWSELSLAFQVPLGNTIQPMMAAQTLVLLLALGLGAWGCAFALRRLPRPAGIAMGAFTAAYLLMPVLSAPMHAGWGRYLIVAFPAAWALSSNLKEGSLRRFAAISLLAQCAMLCAAVLVPVTP